MSQYQNVPIPVDIPYQTFVVFGTNTPWNDSAISDYNGISYFPANASQATVQNIVSTAMTQYLTMGTAEGTHDINAGTYMIRVAWQPDSDSTSNEGFTITQMYPY